MPVLQMLGKLYALVGGVCAEDNPDALTHHELLLPGHLLMKFLREKLEDCLGVFKDMIRRDLEKNPGIVNFQARALSPARARKPCTLPELCT